MLQSVSDRQRILLLFLIMAVAAAAAAGVSIWVLYRAAFFEQRERLVEMVKSQARLIESVARFNADFSQKNPSKGANAAVLIQVVNAQRQYKGFGRTGEFALARRSGETIETLLTGRGVDRGTPRPIPFESERAEPMRLALLGLSGTVEGLDYRGVRVLAAHEPVAFLNWGLVAKMDLAEIRAPFIHAGIISGTAALVIIALGSVLFRRVSSPIVDRLESTVTSLANAQRMARIGNWDWNIENDIVHWSDETYRIFGLKPKASSLTYDDFLNTVHPEDRAMVEAAVGRSLRDKVPYDLDRRVLRPDGSVRIVHSQGEAIFDERGRPLRMAGTVQDITERKGAEDALRDSELRFRNLIEGSIQGIFIHRDFKPLFVNQACADIFGYDGSEEILQLDSLLTLIAPSDHARMTRYKERRLKGEDAPAAYEVRGVRKDGSLIWLENRTRVVPWQGQPAIQSTTVNITERKRAEDALRDSEERFRALLDNAPQSIYLKDLDGHYLLVNRSFEKRVGVSFGEARGKTIYDFFPKDVGDAYTEQDRQVVETGQAIPLEIQVLYPDGVQRTVLTIKFPVFGSDGETVAIGAVTTDITERKLAEEALRESEERHRNFAADVAHELRTPLAVLRSHVDSIESSAAARSMRHDVDAMARLVEQLLAASMLDSLAIEPGDEADLHKICTDVAAYLAPLAIQEDRSIEVTGCDGPVRVKGNADALEQAVRNLVENAIRYSARRTVVTIEVSEDATVRVIDRGRGVPASIRSKVFTRFMRADRRTGGAGLGLSIVQRTVEAHDGTIEVGDNPEGGAVFTLRLPLERILSQPRESVRQDA